MSYLRKVDFATLDGVVKQSQCLLDRKDDAEASTMIHYAWSPPSVAPAERHTHPVDQIYFVISGQMDLEIDGEPFQADAGTLVVIPAGVSHCNWNGGSEPAVHLAITAGLPKDLPLATTVSEDFTRKGKR